MRPFDSLRGRREFTLAMRRGSSASSPALTLHVFAPKSAATARAKLGVIVTKKVGKAVTRNRIRRRVKAIVAARFATEPPRWFVVSCKPAAAATPFASLGEQLLATAARAASATSRR